MCSAYRGRQTSGKEEYSRATEKKARFSSLPDKSTSISRSCANTVALGAFVTQDQIASRCGLSCKIATHCEIKREGSFDAIICLYASDKVVCYLCQPKATCKRYIPHAGNPHDAIPHDATPFNKRRAPGSFAPDAKRRRRGVISLLVFVKPAAGFPYPASQ